MTKEAAMGHTYQELRVWQESVEMVINVYRLTCRLGYVSEPNLKVILKQSGAVNAMLSGLMQSMSSAA
jgi:hypothetical protein